MANFKKSGIPIENLFRNAAETMSLLDHSTDGSDEERFSKFGKLVEEFSIAEKNLDAKRKNENALRQRYTLLQTTKTGVDFSRLVKEEDQRTLKEALEHPLGDTVISDATAKTLYDIITGAEQKLALFKAQTAEVLNYLKTATARYSAISHSGFDEADAFGSKIAKNECEDLLSRASVSPLDFSESHKKRTEELLTLAESRIEKAKDTHDWIGEITQKANDVSNDLTRAFLEVNDAIGKIKGDSTAFKVRIHGIETSLSTDWNTCWEDFNTAMMDLSANPFERQEKQCYVAENSVRRLEEIKDATFVQIKSLTESITQRVMTEAVSRILSEAHDEEKNNAAINFYGFHLGMMINDAAILARNYGLADDEWGCEVADSGKRVKAIKFTLLGIKRITRSGNTYGSILASVREKLKMPESDDSITQVRTISKQIARITEDDGLRIFHEQDGDPAKSMLGRGWEKAKDTINKSDELDLLGGLLLLNAFGL